MIQSRPPELILMMLAYYAPNVDMIQFDEEANFYYYYYYYEEQQNININSIAAALPVPEDEPLDASDLYIWPFV